jgi:hypothetical protein
MSVFVGITYTFTKIPTYFPHVWSTVYPSQLTFDKDLEDGAAQTFHFGFESFAGSQLWINLGKGCLEQLQ